MKLSIITITYNCQNTIARCLESISKQTFKSLEYIIVDGGSTDGTLKVIESYSKIIDKFISEPDEGIYDALNKGLSMATGDIIGFLHADDVFASNMTLNNIMHVFMSFKADVVYGDVEILKNIDDIKPKRKWISRKFHPSLLNLGWMPPHTSLFVKSSLYSELVNLILHFPFQVIMNLFCDYSKKRIETLLPFGNYCKNVTWRKKYSKF